MAKDSKSKASVFSSGPVLEKDGVQKLMDNLFVQFLAFALFVSAIVVILLGGVGDADRGLDADAIGQVAPYSIEAHRDFTFAEKDLQATNELRQQVADAVPPVFDWNEDRGQEISANIDRAFETMRQELADASRQQLEQEDPLRLQALEDEATSDELLTQSLIDASSVGQRLQWARQARDEAFESHLDTRLARSHFDEFARAGFSPEAQRVLSHLIEETMTELIISNGRRLGESREQGIYLRRLRDGSPVIEYHVSDLDDRFIHLGEVAPLIDDALQGARVAIDNASLRDAITEAAQALVEPNTEYNESATLSKRQRARDSVADQMVREQFREGQTIVDEGRIFTDRDYRILQEMEAGDDGYGATQIVIGVTLLALLVLISTYGFGRRNIRQFQPSPRDLVFLATTLLIMLLLTRVGTAVSHALAEQSTTIDLEGWYLLIPVAAGGMLIRLVLDSEHAVMFTLLFALFVGVIAGTSLFFAIYTIVGTLVGITMVQQVKHRMALMWSGLAVGGVNAMTVLGYLLLQGELLQAATFYHLLFSIGGGVAAGFFILAVLPVFESIFGYTTDIKLLELANLNQPALRELILRAPGSYHHSMMVGSLCEAAAEAIGANALLARVGSYYHDIGKANNPQYFAENQKAGQNPHDKLKPNMSALIIKAHVKDGLDMARRHRLPQQIQDFIAEHHGDSLIAYFYHKAKEAEDPNIPEVKEEDYRYPGPRPQSRETAICLLADGVEAASRAMPNPTPARLRGLVKKMIHRAFSDGQLDECDLTLQDLNKIGDAFNRILTGIYHQRPEYPDDKKKAKPQDKARVQEPDEIEEQSGSDGADTSDSKEGNDASGGQRRDDDGDSKGHRTSHRKDRDTPRADLPRLGSQ